MCRTRSRKHIKAMPIKARATRHDVSRVLFPIFQFSDVHIGWYPPQLGYKSPDQCLKRPTRRSINLGRSNRPQRYPSSTTFPL